MATMNGWKVEQHVAQAVKSFAKAEGADLNTITAEMVVAFAQYKAEELTKRDAKVAALKTKIGALGNDLSKGYEKATLISQLRHLDSTPAEDPTYHNPKWSNYVLTAADWANVVTDASVVMSYVK